VAASTLKRFRQYVIGRLGLASSDQLETVRAAVTSHERTTTLEAREATRRLDRVEHKLQAALEAFDHRQVSKRLDRIEQTLDGLIQKLDGVDGVLRRGRLRKVDENVDALIRHTFLTGSMPAPQAILTRRFRGLSQNEEDGITIALFDRVGVSTRRFVEIGAGVNGGNSGFFARECGWTGVMLEIDEARVRTLQRRFGPSVRAVQARVTRDNVNELLTANGGAGDVDLLSVDIDGVDFWVWEALSVARPRIVVAEYNPSFGSERAVTVPYAPDFDRHQYSVTRSAYYGASLAALSRLGVRKGYRLVVVEPRGVNAFFVREDLAGDLPALACERVPLAVERDDWLEPEALFTELARAGLSLVDVA